MQESLSNLLTTILKSQIWYSSHLGLEPEPYGEFCVYQSNSWGVSLFTKPCILTLVILANSQVAT